MKNKSGIILLFALVILISCGKNTTSYENTTLDCHVYGHILEGIYIHNIALDNQGHAWMSGFSHGLIHYNGQTHFYDASKDWSIWDIAVDHNNIVWMGTSDGLVRFDGTNFQVFNTGNSPLPENYVSNLAVDAQNKLWLSPCRSQSGGLMVLDGDEWTLYTPDNSPLPGYGIMDIAIDDADNVWVSRNGSNRTIIRIHNETWTLFDKDDFGFTPYFFDKLSPGSGGRIFVSIDYRLSSLADNSRPQVVLFDKNHWEIIYPIEPQSSNPGHINLLSSKYNGKIWAGIHTDQQCFLATFNDRQWQYAVNPLPASRCYCIAVHVDGSLWCGTGDGVFIIKEQPLVDF